MRLLLAAALVAAAGLPAPPTVTRHYLTSRKVVDGPQPLRIAHVAAPPGPDELRALRTAVCDLIVYTGPNPPEGAGRARLAELAGLGPAFAVREGTDTPPIAGCGLRVLDDPIQLTLRGQAVDLALAERGPAALPALLRALALRPSFKVLAARSADLAPLVAADPGHGVDLCLVALAGRSGLRRGLSPRGALKVHVAGGAGTAIFTLGADFSQL